MHLNDDFTTGNMVADLAEDVWHKRLTLLPSKDRLSKAYLAYRISVTDFEHDIAENFYVHLVILNEYWYATINNKAPHDIADKSELIFGSDSEDRMHRFKSWRHYAFSDVMSKAVSEHIKNIVNKMDDPSRPFLHDTFPLESVEDYVFEAGDVMITAGEDAG